MEHLSYNQNQIQKQRKIYTEGRISLIAFLGGTLGVGYAMAQNFKALNQPHKVRITWYITIAATVLLLGGAVILPEYYNNHIPHQFIPLIIAAVALGLMRTFQKQKIEAHLANEGKKYGWWHSAVIGIVSGVVSALFFFATMVFVFDIKRYGEAGDGIRFNRFSISVHELDKIAYAMKEADLFGFANYHRVVTVERVGNRLEIIFVVDEGFLNNYEAVEYFREVGAITQNHFPHTPIVIVLTPYRMHGALRGQNQRRLGGFVYTPPDVTVNTIHRRIRGQMAAQESVVINGVRWATRNVDAPGTFAEFPESAGMFFQWNRRKGWSATGDVTDWDTTNAPGTRWYAENDPCPPGWRVPTFAEFDLLQDADVTWERLNGVLGILRGTEPNQIFLPLVRARYSDGTILYAEGMWGTYWMRTKYDNENALSLLIDLEYNKVVSLYSLRNRGRNVRCVEDVYHSETIDCLWEKWGKRDLSDP